jgi:hypothetical protein
MYMMAGLLPPPPKVCVHTTTMLICYYTKYKHSHTSAVCGLENSQHVLELLNPAAILLPPTTTHLRGWERRRL